MTKTRMFIYGVTAMLVLMAGIAFWKWHQWRITADAGAAYAARITCSCRYIGGRGAHSCARDIADDAGAVTIEEDASAHRITGTVPMLAQRSAILRPGFGCIVEPR